MHLLGSGCAAADASGRYCSRVDQKDNMEEAAATAPDLGCSHEVPRLWRLIQRQGTPAAAVPAGGLQGLEAVSGSARRRHPAAHL